MTAPLQFDGSRALTKPQRMAQEFGAAVDGRRCAGCAHLTAGRRCRLYAEAFGVNSRWSPEWGACASWAAHTARGLERGRA